MVGHIKLVLGRGSLLGSVPSFKTRLRESPAAGHPGKQDDVAVTGVDVSAVDGPNRRKTREIVVGKVKKDSQW